MSERFPITFTPAGVAGIWLRAHHPNAGEADIASLASIIQGIYLDGMTNGMRRATEVIDESPTLSAARATLEADIEEVIRRAKVDA